MSVRRREFLSVSVSAGLTLLMPPEPARARQIDGRLLGTVPLGRKARRAPPFATLLSSGLNARLFTDLSTLTSNTLVTTNERFFVRTACPVALPPAHNWSIRMAGIVEQPHAIPLASLGRQIRPAGTHLLECSGNADPTNFGLMSVARWEGIPIAALLARARPRPGAHRVLVTGVDDLAPSPTSVPGASWIFSREELERAGAFLATRMNRAPLPRDHGYPIRLVIPGWYGCACIKWVNQIDFVDDDVPATSQMREFARRTHQEGTPTLARDFTPATIDHAATPVRIEKWAVRGRLVYRVVGILWGGSRPTDALVIRFNRDQPFVAVDDCPVPASTATWSLWSHTWQPEAPGDYEIALRVNDPTIRTRRLDRDLYAREVAIDEV